MSSRRRKSESLWDRKEEAGPQNELKDFDSSFLGDNSPKRSNSETNDVLMSDDFSTREPMQGSENMLMDNDKHRMKTGPTFDEWESQYGSRPSDNNYGQPYRVNDRGVDGTGNTSRDRDRSRSRSSSPNRNRARDAHRDRTRGRDSGRARASPSRGSGSIRPEYSGGGSRDRNSNSKDSDGYKKETVRNEETRDYHRNNRSGYNDQDHRRQSNQSIKTPCRFFIMGNCNRNRCKFSHDLNPNFDTFPNSDPNFDEKNKSWNDPSWNNPESGGFDDVSRDMDTGNNQESQFIRDSSPLDGQQIHSYGQNISSQLPTNLNGDGPIEASRNDNPQVTSETLANALGLLHSLPNPPSSGGPIDSTVGQQNLDTTVNEPVKASVPETQPSVEPVKNPEVNENPTGQPENTNLGKSDAQGKVEEGNIGNDEKAMRAFKTALVEFVKEILKPTWKEGKMNREVYKTIVKKVVEKVTSTIQGNQIPRTQEKIDQYLSFSKSKITKLVEAYVGRFQKA